MKDLTHRQKEILDWILDVVEEKGYFPSFREIGLAFEFRSTATVSKHINALVKKGYLIREGNLGTWEEVVKPVHDPARKRTRIYPAAKTRRRKGIPIVGRVAAGRPILAEEHIEDRLDLGDLYGGEDVFAVRVEGESMRDAGILDGDLAIVRSQSRVANGEMAIAYLGEDQEVTVKVFRTKGDRVELLPENPDYPTIRVEPDDPHFRIGGKVIGVVRSYR